MATKTELEGDHSAYHELMARANSAVAENRFMAAIEAALAAADRVDGMMQFGRKYLNADYEDAECFTIVARCAPPMFDLSAVGALELLLKSQRRVQKNTSADLVELVNATRENVWSAHRLWCFIDAHPGISDKELAEQCNATNDWRRWLQDWIECGAIRRFADGDSTRFDIATRMESPVSAKCPECGAVCRAPKSKFLESQSCPKCRQEVAFVLLGDGGFALPTP